MSTQPATGGSNHPLGTNGDLRRRLLRHHVPLAFACVVVVVLFMTLAVFDATKYPHGDFFSGAFPRQRGSNATGSMDHGGESTRGRRGGTSSEATRHGADHTGPSPGETRRHRFSRQFTVATGYAALALLAVTLLIGPANLVLGRRNPVSNYLSRDVGTWAAAASILHVIFGLHVHGRGRLRDFLNYFVAPDGSLWTNSFGLANWTGLAALVIVIGLLAISSDAALRKLKARSWKRLQRLNYGLFALVVLHAFFYGALLRVTSPYTVLLGLTVVAVVVGQALGVWLWRPAYAHTRTGLVK